jgi:hypothetical protein
MSKPTFVIVLCEDNLTFTFLRKYLQRCGVDRRGIRSEVSPSGRGAAENWVIRNFPVQVDAYRISKARKTTWLIVALDADRGTVTGRIEQLSASLRHCANPRLQDIDLESEKIARLVPRRNVETWILILSGTSADEENDFSRDKQKESWYELIDPAVIELYEWTRPNAQFSDRCIPSLCHGLDELRNLSRLVR